LAGFGKVLSVDEFVKSPPPGTAGAILLGKTRNQPHNLYWHLADAHGMQPWTKSYPQALGPRYRDHLDAPDCTRKFMDGLFTSPALKDKPIVFLCPTNVTKPGAGKYTRQEMEYLLADPERAKRVVLVAGADDYIDAAAVGASADTARKRFDRVRATIDARRGGSAASHPPTRPETHPAEFDDVAAFDWDAAKHPHGAHGYWAPRAATGDGADDQAAGRPHGQNPPSPDPIHIAYRNSAGADQPHADACRDWLSALDAPTLGAIKSYTGGAYYAINSALRTRSPESLKIDARPPAPATVAAAERIRAALARAPRAASPVTSYRGVRSRFAKNLSKMEDGFRAALATGQTVTLEGFNSASINPLLAAAWTPPTGFVLEIKSRRGVDISSVSDAQSEREILHNHGSQFRVTGVRDAVYHGPEGGTNEPLPRRTYTLEEVEPVAPVAPDSPAAFYDPEQPRGDHGRWAGTGADQMRRLTASWSHGLTEGERGAVKLYTGPAYAPINQNLRTHPDSFSSIDATHRRLIRGLDAAIRKYPKHPVQTSYRGMTVTDDAKWAGLRAGFEAAHATGGTVTLNGFTSASLDPKIAAIFGGGDRGRAVLEINSPRGAFLGLAASSGGEKEVLHNHGERFKVVAIEDRTYSDVFGNPIVRPTYVLEAVDEPPPPLPPEPPKAATFYNPDQPRGEHGRWSAGQSFDPRQSFGDADVRPRHPLLADQLPAEIKDQAAAWAASLTANERDAIGSYVYFGYKDMNRAMADTDGDPRKVPDLGYYGDPGRRLHLLADAADKHPPLAHPLTGWRVMALRPSRMSEFVAAAEAAHATGGELRMPVFGSTTLNPDKAVASSSPVENAIRKDNERDSVLLEITSRTGLLLGPAKFSNNPRLEQEENEVLQRPGARYRVLGWKDVSFGSEKRRVLRLEEVPPGTPSVTPPVAPPAVAPVAPPAPAAPVPTGLWGRIRRAVGFGEWNPDLHPHGEHGHWAPRTATGGAAPSSPPPAAAEPPPRLRAGRA
jgi:hypothetical protein